MINLSIKLINHRYLFNFIISLCHLLKLKDLILMLQFFNLYHLFLILILNNFTLFKVIQLFHFINAILIIAQLIYYVIQVN